MKTAVRRVLLMSALMSPGALYALGLGEIRLNSALNQPFDAEIELVSATQEDLGALRATLASGDTFSRYGLDRPAYLSEFNFQVTKGPGGRDVLRVTSPRPVTEPFVTLLIEANWPRGRLLREYTVLLDPPVFTPGPAATETVSAPRASSGGATSVRAAAPVAAAVETPAAAPAPEATAAPAAPSTIAPGESYQVRPNDTLWKIASRVNPGTRSDVNRAMVSIYQSNPQAFDDNINVLRSGSTLRIPDSSEIQAISAAAASAEVARQYEAWRSGAAAAAGGDAGRLRLVTPEQGAATPSTTVAAAPAAAAPEPGATAASTGDIENRVKQLEAELAEARRLLEVRNAELATLQGGAPAPGEGVAAPTEGTAPATEAAATPAEEGAEVAAPAAEAPAAEPAGPSLVERLRDYWWVLAALLAAALGFVLFQRMRREHGTAEENLEEALGARDLRTPPTYTPKTREADILVEEKRTLEPIRPASLGTAGAVVEPARRSVTVEETLSGEAPGSTESGDPLAEADFHMAYGLYDQAADLVQLALKREPQRRDLKLKLLEIFFVWGNRDRFLELARELNAVRGHAPSGEWDKVLIMGKQIAPEEPMFAASPSAGSDSLDLELHSATSALDLDVSGMTDTATDVEIGERDTATTDATGLDFVLGDETQSPVGDSQVAPTIETPRVRGAKEEASDTQELTVDDLGLDVDSLRDLEALNGGDTIESPRGTTTSDTIETESPATAGQRAFDEDEQDLLSSTSLLDSTALMEPEGGVIDLSESTGELASLDADLSPTGMMKRGNFDLGGEPPTMSEVGTKLDLARAYMDMGDPEGARSILDEVLQEGNSGQRQEAERLIASLP
ncbi:MAG TPA: FimV/HubP family polar landmark protein [Steroidobacteraceae bacterium]|nr:FimV/HubP family polar landmark protein [Steroidobacteraceae bacterium]